MDNKLTAELQQRLAELQEIFQQQLPGRLDEITTSWQQLRQEWSDQSLAQLHRQCHSLAGSSGTFGAHEVSDTARQLEQMLKAIIESERSPDSSLVPQIEQRLAMLNDAAERWGPPH